MNQTSEFALQFIQVPIPTATRFINILVGLFNKGNQPVQDFIFSTPAGDVPVSSTDPGRALITGNINDLDAFKISAAARHPEDGALLPRQLREDARGSGRALHQVLRLRHRSRRSGGSRAGFIQLTPQDEADMVAFMKLLD